MLRPMVSWTLKQQRDPKVLNRLQRTQESIYAQLQCLIPDWQAADGYWVSQAPQSQPLHIEMLEVHPYTTFLHMTHHFDGPIPIVSQPEAHVRCYHDLRIAEVTAFDVVQGIERVAHPKLPARAVQELSWQRNRSLEKWLQYLLDKGHCRSTMRASRSTAGHLEATFGKKNVATI